MRDLQLEAAIWYLFTSKEFFELTARECEETMKWFGNLAISRQVANFGRNNQIYDVLKKRAADFRRGAELASLGDYRMIWEVSDCIRGDARGMMEQPLHSWMTESEYLEFTEVKIERIMTFSEQITSALNNGMVKGESFYHPNPDCPERRDDDDGFPGDEIVEIYNETIEEYREQSFWALPDPLPKYEIDKSITCKTGEKVPWTGVWYPAVGLENHSLTFAMEGFRMQPAFRVIKTAEEIGAEGELCPVAETVAVETSWHPLVPSTDQPKTKKELWAKEGEPCPKAGVWQPTDPGASNRFYEAGETMASLKSAYGLSVWKWIADR